MLSRHLLPLASIFGMTVFLPVPRDRNSPVPSGSPMVADNPMRRGLTPAIRDSRSIKHSVYPPRSPRRRECTSSMTTKRRSPNNLAMAACLCRSSASKDSGVI